MNLRDNKYIPKRLLRQLEQDTWTMESLATAKVMHLIRYRGIGPNVAYKIVNEASRLVNATRLQESKELDPQLPIPEPQPEDPPVSARVRRIKEQNQ